MSITLDGTAYWIRSGPLHRIASSKKGTLSAWVTVGANDGASMNLFSIGGDLTFSLQRASTNKFIIAGGDSTGHTVLGMTSTTSYTESSTWLHIGASWDVENSTGHLYVNRSDDLNTATDVYVDSAINYATGTPCGFACKSDGTQGWVGSVYEFLLWPGVYLDLSDKDELKKLVSSDGVTNSDGTVYANPGPTAGTPKPVGYGAQGALVGAPAAIIFSGAFTGNRGTGGKFTQTGSFSWVDPSNDIKIYRQTGAPDAYPGERSFDSERTGLTYARHNTFIERREGLSDSGKRLGIPERKDRTRHERPGHEQNFSRLIYGDEDDSEDRR